VREAHDALPRRATRAGAVRAIVADRLPAVLTLDEVAAALRVSPRSLQRSLRDEGWSLSTVLDAVRKERAEALLGRGEPIGEVAWQLGYSTPSAFHRAFRRWYGSAPDAFRAASVQPPRESC
jgi:AraC-like DNA-binding protein